MDISTERHEDRVSRTVELARYDDQIIGASIFLSVPELRSAGIDLDGADQLQLETVDSRHGTVIKIATKAGSRAGGETSSLTD